MKFWQVDEKNWIKSDYRVFAQIKPDISYFEENFQTKFEEIEVDGMGKAKYALFATENNRYFVIDVYNSNSVNHSTQIHLLNNFETLTDDLDRVLQVLKLTSEDLVWVDKDIQFAPYELWRQDDNGHKFLIETFPYKADAEKAKREFENRRHKQIYWLEKVQKSDS